MKLKPAFVFMSAVLIASAYGAESTVAEAAIQAAFNRQKARAGHVEHHFGRISLMLTRNMVASEIAAQVKDRVLEKATEKVLESTARVPLVAEAVAIESAQLQDKMAATLDQGLGPEQELMKVEYAGTRRHEVFTGSLGGMGEFVRANGRVAVRFDLGPQIAQLKLAVAFTSGERIVNEARSVRNSIKSISRAVTQGGAAGLVGGAIEAFDEVIQLLNLARDTAQILHIIGMLEKMSGKWECHPDPASQVHTGKVIEAHQLADETIGDVPTHVYVETRAFAMFGAFRDEADGDEAAGPAAPGLQTRIWIRISDGLPVRSELRFPTGDTQRTEYSYPAVVDFPMPDCLSKP